MKTLILIVACLCMSSCLYIAYPTDDGTAKMIAVFKSAEGVLFKKDENGVEVSVDSTHSVDVYEQADKALDLISKAKGND